MFNLLSDKTKNSIRREYQKRLWTTFCLAVFFALAMVILVFTPILFTTQEIKNKLNNELQNLRSSTEIVDYKDMVAELKQSNDQITLLKPESQDYIIISDLITSVLEVKSKNILLERFSWRLSQTEGNLMFYGVAQNRDALKDFVSEIEKLDEFDAVEVPLSSFTKATSADFNLSLKIHINDKEKTNEK